MLKKLEVGHSSWFVYPLRGANTEALSEGVFTSSGPGSCAIEMAYPTSSGVVVASYVAGPGDATCESLGEIEIYQSQEEGGYSSLGGESELYVIGPISLPSSAATAGALSIPLAL